MNFDNQFYTVYTNASDLAAIVAGLVKEGIVFEARLLTNLPDGTYEIRMSGGF
tara:strand:- start:344 stop:502 length:159 start_codon:yes stop_codon:yes gene_type:complete